MGTMTPGYPSRHTMERPRELKPRPLAQRSPLPFKRPGARVFVSFGTYKACCVIVMLHTECECAPDQHITRQVPLQVWT